MKKALVVGKSEFLTAIKSKGFIIGVLLMPILVALSITIQAMSERHADATDRVFAVLDGTGELHDVLVRAAAARDEQIAKRRPEDPPLARFVPTRDTEAPESPDERRLRLSEKIRSGALFAFVEIPPAVLAPDGAVRDTLLYYSNKPTYEDLRFWIAETVNEAVRERRFTAAGLTRDVYERIAAPVPSEHRGLTSKTATGAIAASQAVNPFKTWWVPMILMFLLWMVVMSAVPQLLNSAIEEKMTRVSEVLLGSVTPFELMMGKLLASTGVCAVLAALYITGGVVVAYDSGRGADIPWGLLPYFVVFMLLAVFFFGSVFIAIGAACSELKDAQGLMAPAMVVLMIPIFVWMPVLKNPDSTLAVVASLFPPATPMLMLLRLSSNPAPPAWQVVLSIVLTSAATLLCVWAAGKVFRIGILAQGKTPGFRELIRWVTSS